MKGRPPGLLRPKENPDVIMMICTAGHVDHGKTRLVRTLTGCETDRLRVEKERGLTIELGFAPCMLGGELCIGIVDVPGHEKFVRNMVAGVSGIDMTILVIAADDGIMPQTIEHFQIMELLGVRHGIVALTKTDLVTPERVEELQLEIRAFFEGTFLADAAICPLSVETGDGFFPFYERLVAEIEGLTARRRQGVFRLPVERVFQKKGFGVVATGIPVAGDIKVGDQVELVPGGAAGKVRGIQRFLRDATEGGCGQCLALNIPDLIKTPPVRGQVLCRPGYLRPAKCFHVRLQTVAGMNRPLRNAEAVKLHTGTSETPARLYLLEDKSADSGVKTFAAIVTSEPVAAAPHDRFIIRRSSPAVTVAGGEVLNVTHAASRPRRKAALDMLRSYTEALADTDPHSMEGMKRRIEWVLLRRPSFGASAKELTLELFEPADDVNAAAQALASDGILKALEPDLFVHAERHAECIEQMQQRITEHLEADGALRLTHGELRKGLDWPDPLWDSVRDELEQARLISRRGGKLVLREAAFDLSERDQVLADRLVAIYDETGFSSPRPDELYGMVDAAPKDVDRMFKYLCDAEQLVRLGKNVVLSYASFRKAEELVVKHIQEQGPLDSADFKNLIRSSRKYALAILDYLDSRRVTVRYGNERRLAPDFERNLL